MSTDLSAAQFKTQLHEALRLRGLSLLENYLDEVEVDGDIDDKRKAVELVIKTLNIAVEPTQNQTLPTIAINFVGGAFQVTHSAQPGQPSESIPLVEEVLPETLPLPDEEASLAADSAEAEIPQLEGLNALLSNLNLISKGE